MTRTVSQSAAKSFSKPSIFSSGSVTSSGADTSPRRVTIRSVLVTVPGSLRGTISSSRWRLAKTSFRSSSRSLIATDSKSVRLSPNTAIDWSSAATEITVAVSAEVVILRIEGAPSDTRSSSQPSFMSTTSLQAPSARAAVRAATAYLNDVNFIVLQVIFRGSTD